MEKPIVTDGDAVLRDKAQPVSEKEFGTDELQALLTDLSDTLRVAPNGVAIAAPQIGVSKQIFVVRGFIMAERMRHDPESDSITDVAFINPKIVRASRKKERFDEGCLSVPGVYGTIVRSHQVTVQAQDVTGTSFEVNAAGLLAEIFQHEIDHLEGVLFIDNAEEAYKTENHET